MIAFIIFSYINVLLRKYFIYINYIEYLYTGYSPKYDLSGILRFLIDKKEHFQRKLNGKELREISLGESSKRQLRLKTTSILYGLHLLVNSCVYIAEILVVGYHYRVIWFDC